LPSGDWTNLSSRRLRGQSGRRCKNYCETAQEEALKSCFNGAVKKAQRLMAKKMQEMGGIPGLS